MRVARNCSRTICSLLHGNYRRRMSTCFTGSLLNCSYRSVSTLETRADSGGVEDSSNMAQIHLQEAERTPKFWMLRQTKVLSKGMMSQLAEHSNDRRNIPEPTQRNGRNWKMGTNHRTGISMANIVHHCSPRFEDRDSC